MPRPNPPRKRPRRRPDAVERNTRAEVSLTKQTAQVKERSGPEPKSANAKPQPKAAKPGKGAPAAARAPHRRAVRPVGEALVRDPRRVHRGRRAHRRRGRVLHARRPPRPDFGLYLLGLSYNPLIVLAAALVAAPIAKFITKERGRCGSWNRSWPASSSTSSGWPSSSPSRSWSADSARPRPRRPTARRRQPPHHCRRHPRRRRPPPRHRRPPSSSASSAASTATVVATPVAIAGLAIIDVLSFVGDLLSLPAAVSADADQAAASARTAAAEAAEAGA